MWSHRKPPDHETTQPVNHTFAQSFNFQNLQPTQPPNHPDTHSFKRPTTQPLNRSPAEWVNEWLGDEVLG
eukprot:10553071-Alexandrium_andersonii.AAC.1